MPTAQHNQSFTFPGYAFSSQEAAVSGEGVVAYEIPLAAVSAQNVGTLDERVDNDTGLANLGASHTIVPGKVDVYWSGGVRYGMDATASGTDVTIDGGAGDNLPVLSTAITVVQQTTVSPCDIDGDNAEIVGIFYRNASDQSANAHVDLQDSGSATIAEHDVVHETAFGGLDLITNINGGDTNIYTGNPITKAQVSHDSTTSAGTLYILALINSVA